MTLSGMNVESILEMSNRLTLQASRLEETTRAVDVLVSISLQNWRGPSVLQFQERWEATYRPQGSATARHLRDLADVARRNAEGQRQTSGTLGTTADARPLSANVTPHQNRAWWQSGLQWFGAQADAGLDWAAGGVNWVRDRVDDASGFVGARVDATFPALTRLQGGAGILGSQFVRIFTEGRVPQVSEIGASLVIVGATGMGVGMNLVAGRDLEFFEPGIPWAGKPLPVTSLRNPAEAPPVTDMAGLTGAAMSTYDGQGIRVDAVTGADGLTRYIVTIPGTEDDIKAPASWAGNEDGHDWAANPYALAQGSAATNARAVRMAIENAVPPGAEVVLAGHSQGGIIAANLAADESFSGHYDVAAVVAYGAPVQTADLPPAGPRAVPVLSVEDPPQWVWDQGPLGISVPRLTSPGDPVPQLDLGGAGPGGALERPSITVLHLPSPGMDPLAHHDGGSYLSSMRALSPQQQEVVARFEAESGLARFYTGPGTTSSVSRVQFGG